MSDASLIKRNSIYSFFAVASRLVANVFVFWFIARLYGPNLLGQISYAHSAATIFLVLADFGFDVLITTELARNREKASTLVSKYLTVKMVLTIGSLFIMWAFIFIKQLDYDWSITIFIFSIYMVLATIANFLFALFKGFEKYEYEARISVVMNAILLIGTIVFIYLDADIKWICALFAVSRIPGIALSLKYIKKVLPGIKIVLNFEKFGDTFKKSVVFGLLLISLNIFLQGDTIILGIFKTKYEVGIYQAVIKIVFVLMVLPQVVTNAIIPMLSRFHKENIVRWEMLGRAYHKGMFISALAFSLILFLYSDEIINLIYKDKYQASGFILKIFSFTVFFRYFLEAMGVMLTTSLRQKKQMYVAVGVTLASLAANIIFIPKYGFTGAAYVCLAATIIMLLGYFLLNMKMIFKWVIDKHNIYPMVTTIVLYLILSNVERIPYYLAIILILAVYTIVAYFFYFTKDEKNKIFVYDVNDMFNKN